MLLKGETGKKQLKNQRKQQPKLNLRDLSGSTYHVGVSHSNTRSLQPVFEQKIRRLVS